jgi:hypothetical protein
MQFTLLVLAAGMGSRYGGLKQIDPVGPSGETVLDYAVFDAIRAGFTRVVFVIRRDFEAMFRDQIASKYAGRVAVDYVFQSTNELPGGFTTPAGREKPWGTGHAVWCARDAVTEEFAVINADDFYGADSFVQLANFFAVSRAGTSTESPIRLAMVGFRLANTLSEHGAVSRGVCAIDVAGQLRSITEQTGITREDVGLTKSFSGEETVSMNCWGFSPAVFGLLDRQFREFLTARIGEPKAEFYLPTAISTSVERREATVQVLPTTSTWFGVTFREDKPRVQAALQAFVDAGVYPKKLF